MLLAIYIRKIMSGVNYQKKSSLRLAIYKRYAPSVERLFMLRKCPTLTVFFSDETNWTRTIIQDLEREGHIACQRKLLDDKIHTQIISEGKNAGEYLLEVAVADVVSSGKTTGWRASDRRCTKTHPGQQNTIEKGLQLVTLVIAVYASNYFLSCKQTSNCQESFESGGWRVRCQKHQNSEKIAVSKAVV